MLDEKKYSNYEENYQLVQITRKPSQSRFVSNEMVV